MTPILPGQARAKKPLPREKLVPAPFDKRAMRTAILAALAKGPVPSWDLQIKVALDRVRLYRQLEALRLQQLVKRVGSKRRGTWALITWLAPEQRAFNQPPVPKLVKAPPATSWWLDQSTRDGFNEAAAHRNAEMASDGNWRKTQASFDRFEHS